MNVRQHNRERGERLDPGTPGSARTDLFSPERKHVVHRAITLEKIRIHLRNADSILNFSCGSKKQIQLV
jgi:hypothetical protein